MLYLWIKAFHIIGVVSWFAGLFYHVRFFVYHAEALAMPEPKRSILAKQYELMESRLFYIIMNPAMWITAGTAAVMLFLPGGRGFLTAPWMLAKYVLVALLIAFHFWCERVMKDFAAGRPTRSGEAYRILNEVPTIILVLVTLLVVLKSSDAWGALAATLVGLVAFIGLGIKAYARHRRRSEAAAEEGAPVAG